MGRRAVRVRRGRVCYGVVCFDNKALSTVATFTGYCQEIDRCFFLPYAEFGCRSQIQLRLGPSKNNQTAGIDRADDFDFDARLKSQLGAVAQLGERVHGMHEVTGSSPVGSIGSA